MKVAVINFSGNVGKTTVARQLLAPRMKGATCFAIESINAGASDDSSNTEQITGTEYGMLQEDLLTLDDAIIDVGASNVEDFVKLMSQFKGSHEDFDYFVVPCVPEKKQQEDTINTIKTLASIGVPAKKIRVVFNRVPLGAADDLGSQFGMVLGFHEAEKRFTLKKDAVLHNSEIYDRLRVLRRTVSDLAADKTDYRAKLREATNEDEKEAAVRTILAQRLAASAKDEHDAVYAILFK